MATAGAEWGHVTYVHATVMTSSAVNSLALFLAITPGERGEGCVLVGHALINSAML